MKKIKKMIWQGIFIIGLFTVLFLVLNFLYTETVIKKTVTYRKNQEFNSFIKNETVIKYAFFGGSHVENSINPRYINGAYNFAGGAKTYFEVYLDLKNLIEKNISVEYAFLELDMHTFSSYLFNFERPVLVNIWHYSRITDIDEIHEATKIPYMKLFIDSRFPVFGNGENFFLIKKESEIYNGYAKRYGNFSYENAEDLTKRRIGRQFRNQEMISNLTMGYFIKTLRLAKENNITVVLVKYPVTKIYDETLSSVVSKKDYYETILSKAGNETDDLYILDYYDIYFDNLEYFDDADHMNHIGSEAFSKKVSKDIAKFK